MTLSVPLNYSLQGSSVHGRQGYQSGLPFPPPVDLPNPAIEDTSPVSSALQADSLPTESSGEGKGYPLQYSDLENSMDYI